MKHLFLVVLGLTTIGVNSLYGNNTYSLQEPVLPPGENFHEILAEDLAEGVVTIQQRQTCDICLTKNVSCVVNQSNTKSCRTCYKLTVAISTWACESIFFEKAFLEAKLEAHADYFKKKMEEAESYMNKYLKEFKARNPRLKTQ